MENKIFEILTEITPVTTAHGQGKKFVFLNQKDVPTNLTQFAYGQFLPGETCKSHSHPTMEEYFFFIKGEGNYEIDNHIYPIAANTFLRIPAGVSHKLKALGNTNLEFVYFGIKTD